MPFPLARHALLAALVLVGLLGAGCASEPASGPGGAVISETADNTPYSGVEIRSHRLPDVTLRDDTGQPYNLAADTTKPVTLVFFGYTNCPDICPTTVANVTQAMRQAPESVTRDVQFLFITSDPARDTPQVMHEWLGRFNDSYIGLTGDLDKIERIAKRLGISMSGKDKLPSGGYLVGHGAQVISFGPDERSRVVWTSSTSVGEYRKDVVRLTQSIQQGSGSG